MAEKFIRRSRWWLWIFLAVTVLYCVFAIAPFILVEHVPGLRGVAPHELGDSFGLANAFFSSLAFAGVVVTLMLQMQELKAQRQEMVEMQRVQMLAIFLENDDIPTEKTQGMKKNAHRDLLMNFLREHVTQYLQQNSLFEFRQIAFMISNRLQDAKIGSLQDTGKDRTAIMYILLDLSNFTGPLKNTSSFSSAENRVLGLFFEICAYALLAIPKEIQTDSFICLLNELEVIVEELVVGRQVTEPAIEKLEKWDIEVKSWLNAPQGVDWSM